MLLHLALSYGLLLRSYTFQHFMPYSTSSCACILYTHQPTSQDFSLVNSYENFPDHECQTAILFLWSHMYVYGLTYAITVHKNQRQHLVPAQSLQTIRFARGSQPTPTGQSKLIQALHSNAKWTYMDVNYNKCRWIGFVLSPTNSVHSWKVFTLVMNSSEAYMVKVHTC